ncbi:hypothetical protein F4801DRAFT_537744 [Xylaria longipes]|nr:hypothetical protein F4801DRAFT_537744 [Xylaria longipes]RYC58483.1 hypothetical protein CHU98_g7725 [Xylaria longipes]
MSSRNRPEKARVCCLKRRAVVYDTTFNSCSIKIDDKIKENYEDYWSFQLGPRKTRADSWDLFLDEETDRITAVGPDLPRRDGALVAGLRLRKLGVWGRILRKTGVLSTGYIVRPETHFHKADTRR